MIERQAVGHSTPSVMACDAEPVKANCLITATMSPAIARFEYGS